MGVNYGLGGFKDGLAYIFAASNDPVTINIDEADQPALFEGELTEIARYDAEVDGASKYSINLFKEGIYLIHWSATSSGANNDDISLNVSYDGTGFFTQGIQQFNSKNGDLWTTSGSLLVKFSISEWNTNTLYFMVQNNTSSEDVVIHNLQISAIRLGGLHTGGKEFVGGTAYGSMCNAEVGSLSYAETDTFYPFGLAMDAKNLLQMNILDERRLSIEQSGYYYLYGSLSISGSSNDNLMMGVFKNGIDQSDVLKSPRQQWNAKGGDMWQTGYSGVLLLTAGDTIEPCIANLTDTTGNTTFANVNFVMSRIGNI